MLVCLSQSIIFIECIKDKQNRYVNCDASNRHSVPRKAQPHEYSLFSFNAFSESHLIK